MNKFLPPCEPPLNPALPLLARSTGPRRSAVRVPLESGKPSVPRKKPQKVTGTRSHAGDDPRRRRAAFRSRRREASEQGEEAAGGGGAWGPGPAGTAGGSGEQPRIPKLSRQRGAAREPAGGGRAERGSASPGFRQAAPSRAPGRKEACLRTGKGRREAGGAKSPPKIETAGGKHKGSQRNAGAGAPSVHAPESCGSGASWGGTESAGLETGHASIQEVTCEHGSWQRL